jgi:hypothetical protein
MLTLKSGCLVFDCKIALIVAVDRHFAFIREARPLLPTYQSVFWLIAKRTFETAEEFNRGFRHVVYVKTKNEYDDILIDFTGDFPRTQCLLKFKRSQRAIELERQELVYVLG